MTLRTIIRNPVTYTIAIDSIILAANLLPLPYRLLTLGAIIYTLLFVLGATCHDAWHDPVRLTYPIGIWARPVCIATWVALAVLVAVSH